MPTNPSAARMAVTPQTSPQFQVEDWVDLPEYIMRRDPAMREWNTLMRESFLRMQSRIAEWTRSVQIES